MRIKIENLKKEPFTSKDGRAFVRVCVLSSGVIYTCLEGAWNKSWAIGQEIDAEVTQETFKGRVQNKIVAPKKDFGGGGNNQAILEKIYLILVEIRDGMAKPRAMIPAFDDQTPAPTMEETGFDGHTDNDSIPF
jgi:hypothetical protein